MAAQLDSSEWRDELRATLGARGELGQEMEDEVIESFLGRLRGSIDKQVEAGVAEAMSHRRRGGISLGRGSRCPVSLHPPACDRRGRRRRLGDCSCRRAYSCCSFQNIRLSPPGRRESVVQRDQVIGLSGTPKTTLVSHVRHLSGDGK